MTAASRAFSIDPLAFAHYSSAMKITVNGESRTVDVSCTAAQLVELMGITSGRVAMEVNREIVPRSTYTQHQFQADDVVEIVHAVGGG